MIMGAGGGRQICNGMRLFSLLTLAAGELRAKLVTLMVNGRGLGD